MLLTHFTSYPKETGIISPGSVQPTCYSRAWLGGWAVPRRQETMPVIVMFAWISRLCVPVCTQTYSASATTKWQKHLLCREPAGCRFKPALGNHDFVQMQVINFSILSPSIFLPLNNGENLRFNYWRKSLYRLPG